MDPPRARSRLRLYQSRCRWLWPVLSTKRIVRPVKSDDLTQNEADLSSLLRSIEWAAVTQGSPGLVKSASILPEAEPPLATVPSCVMAPLKSETPSSKS